MVKLKWIFLSLVIGCLFCEIAQTIILPTFSTISREFHTSGFQIQLTHAAFFLGAVLANLGAPFLSRFIGFDRTYISSVLIVSIISFLSFVSLEIDPTLSLLYPFRALQGFGVQLISTLNQVLVIHYFKNRPEISIMGIHFRKSSTQMFAFLFALLNIAGMGAPILGSYIMDWWNWEATFLFTALLGFLLFFCMLPTLPLNQEVPERSHLDSVLKNHSFLYTAAIACLTTFVLMAYYVESPYLFVDQFGLTAKQYAFYNTIPCTAIIIGSVLTHRLSHYFPHEQLLRIFCFIFFFFALISLSLGLIFTFTPILFVSITFPFFISCGVLNPLATGVALEKVHKYITVAGSFMNLAQMSACFLGTLLGAFIPKTILWGLCLLFAIVGIVIIVSFLKSREKDSRINNS